MYIKSIIIDGFKSYAKRTEVNGFDPMFNAITGLNGSGKSNILDSICFLLGITNLSQVRATNLQELVYKSGQAGVTKASVSITFDNSDKSPGQCPLGYEQYDELTVTRQVVIGGKNKYMINGSNATNSRVSDLFRSVQLNINNPHFLIMQGRITKVLNMKPPEILSMIEEAAGTRLYESKKEQAQKTIEKKDAKLREMDTLLHEEITPALTKLKDERNSFLEFQKITRELEHLNKLYIAYEFIRAEETKEKASVDLGEMMENQKKLDQQLEENESHIAELERMIHELTQKRDQEAGGAMERLEGACKEAAAKSATAKSNVEHERNQLKSEEKKKKELQKNAKDDSSALKAKQTAQEKLTTALGQLEEESVKDQVALTEAQKHLHAVSAGLSKNADGEDATLNDQLMNAQEKIKTSETEEKQAKMKLKHFEVEVKKKRSELKATEKSYEKDKSHYDTMKKDLDKMERELKSIDYEEGCEEQLTTKRRQIAQTCHQLQNKVDQLGARNAGLQFAYKDPEKNFDRSRVHGLLARLFTVKDNNTAQALEIAAGGRLYNVIVDSDLTAQKLIERGELRRRHNFIPLNKITPSSIPADVVRKAKQLVGDQNVHHALSLINYDPKLKKAMEFAFGNVFICKDMETANKVAFAPGIQRRAVSLDGEDFNPAGTLTGGAASQSASLLMALAELQQAETTLHSKQAELEQVEQELNKLNKVGERYQKVKQQYDVRLHEAEMVKDRLEKSSHHQQLEDISDMEKTKDEQQAVLARAQETLKKESERVKDIEHKIKNAKSIRERELKQAEKDVQDVKKRSEESKKKMKEKKQEYETLELEASDLLKEVESYEEQIKTVENILSEINSRIEQLNELAKQIKAEEKSATDALNHQKDLLKSCDKDINAKVHDQKLLHKKSSATKIRQEELKHEMNKHDKDSREAGDKVESMLRKHRWIAEEKKYFGVANTTYDFKANKPKDIHSRINKLQETKEKLSKTINTRAMNMLGKAEEHYNDLMKKRAIVLNDKSKIVRVIEEMDKKKNEALKTAHEQVNKDFGSIFSTLLPGTKAKLVAPEGQSILQGLEVKVAFGDSWKESLSELSGGQRSLVALSLILSMLLFKPAPLYILDEVDAALDLSHTQNIGQMLRTHFRHSQFIVVSLKDGMFNNANVLYKTKFVDGVSTVTRYAQSTNVSRNASSHASKDASGRSKAKKARRGNEENARDTVR